MDYFLSLALFYIVFDVQLMWYICHKDKFLFR